MASQNSKAPFILSLAALIVAVFVLVRPGRETSGAVLAKREPVTFEKIIRAKSMNVCYVQWPPSVIKDPNSGELSGLLVDMIERIGEDGGFKVNYVESSWGGFGADLQTGVSIGVYSF